MVIIADAIEAAYGPLSLEARAVTLYSLCYYNRGVK